MQFLSASDRSADLVGDIVKLQPLFASEAKGLEAFLDTAEGVVVAPLASGFVALRRTATQALWTKGRSAWNEAAGRQIQLMRGLGQQGALIRAVQQIFAADFGEARLEGGLDASGATFAGDLVLCNAALGAALRLDGARLLACFDASGASVAGDVTAEQAQFVGPAVMTGIDVARATRFGFSEFMSNVAFDCARFGKEVWLRHARIAGSFSMRAALLEHDAGLGSCVYGGPAAFDESNFAETVSFEDARFAAKLSLDRCVFASRLQLKGLTLVGGISANGTRFGGDINPPLYEIIALQAPPRDDKRRRGRDAL